MRELESKHRTKSIIYSTPVLVLMLFVVVVFARGAWRAFDKDRDSDQMVRELSEQAGALEKRQIELERGLVRLQTEEGIKEELRSKFNVSQDGEQFVVLLDEPSSEESTSTESRSLVDKWWNGLKNLWP